MKFTPNQTTAINHPPTNMQLIACAGSGKTEVVARRVGELLNPSGNAKFAPRNIVAFTYTEKAAAELKERIVLRVREQHGDVHGLAEMYVGTIHGFCLELLKTEVPEFLKYEVLNEIQQALFIDRNSRKSGLTTSTVINGIPLRRYVDTGNYIKALNILREDERVDKELKGCSILNGLDSYRDLLRQHRYLDYSEILERAVQAVCNDQELRERFAERIRYVIVDEYQDVNPIQEAMVLLLHQLGARICVVGDDDQTLYQWRGSDVQSILTFKKRYPDVKEVYLEENFRSSDGIVLTAREFIEQNADRLSKEMKPTGAQNFQAGDLVALSLDGPDEEAQYIAETMQSLLGVPIKEDDDERGIAWSDMAVLLRSVKNNGAPIMHALAVADIPYVVVGMNNLFDTSEAQAARELFYFLANRSSATKESVKSSWNGTNRGLKDKNLTQAINQADKARKSMADEDDENRWNLYNLQRQFLSFLETAEIREEVVPKDRGEVVFYNLGKFSQLISDFESIHFHSAPQEKYVSFANFLQHRAENAYPEGWLDNQYANPNAVRIMTVHQAKGLQRPVVFLPALLRNRFPAARVGGRTVWHLLPPAGIANQQRYQGGTEDERRLFYVAMTRSQKFLHMTWAPIPGSNNRYQRASEFWDDILVSKYVKRRRQDYSKRKKIKSTPKSGIADVIFSFSDLKYFFECPYQFKLRILYGFNPPIDEAIGYGKSLHDALAEVHARAMRGDIADQTEADQLVETHLHTPYAYPSLRQTLRDAAERVIRNYLEDNTTNLRNVEFSEKKIEINISDGVSMVGRIDLVRRLDTNETTIVDLKSNDRAQPEDVTETQLHIYALGYQELTGTNADYVEIYNLDERQRKPRSVDDDFIDKVKVDVSKAAQALRYGNFDAAPAPKKCSGCDYHRMCTIGCAAVKTN